MTAVKNQTQTTSTVNTIPQIELRTCYGRLEYKTFENVGGVLTPKWKPVPEVNTVLRKTNGGIDWRKVDWDKPTRVLAKELGCSTGLVCRQRHFHGHKAKYARTTRRYSHVAWDQMDWTKNNQMLAKQLGLDPQIVRYERKLRNLPNAPRTAWRCVVTKDEIEATDWVNNRDIDLAEKWGVSRERVRQLRLVNGKPDYKCKYKLGIRPRRSTIQMLDWLNLHRKEIEGKRASEVVRMIPGKTPEAGGRIKLLRKSGIKFDWSKRYLDHDINPKWIDWRLPNVALGLIWGRSNYWAANRRCQTFGGPAEWTIKGIASKCYLDAEFIKAVADESKNARSHGFSSNSKAVADWLTKGIKKAKQHCV